MFVNQMKEKRSLYMNILVGMCRNLFLYIHMEKHSPIRFLGQRLGEGLKVIVMSIEKREGRQHAKSENVKTA